VTFEWGVHVLRPVTPEQLQELARSGVNRLTVALPWRWIGGLGPGPRQWAPLDHFLDPIRASGIPVQGMLGPGMPHLLPDAILNDGGSDHPAYIERFAAYCADAARRLDWIDVFRVEDELNAAPHYESLVTRRRRGQAWRRTEFRLRLLRASVDAVRAARPDAAVRATVHASLPGWKVELRRWLAAGIRVDSIGLSLRPCFILPDPTMAERVGEALAEAREVLEAGPWSANAPPLEIARIGYPTHRGLFSPRKQREFLDIAAAQAREAGATGLHWWSLRDQAHPDPILGYWPPAQERHFGLQYYDGTAKAAMDEFRVVATGDRFGEGAA
jgi:hypothetical protein